jgi:hypothetical protein
MSSRRPKLLSGGVCGIGEEVAVDDVRQSSLEGAYGFHSRVAELHPTLEELLRGWVTSTLRHGDAVDRTVQLAVAGA